MPEHARGVRFRNACLVEPRRDSVPEAMEAKALALQAQRNELLAEKLADTRADLAAL
jgi:hypothetical protein